MIHGDGATYEGQWTRGQQNGFGIKVSLGYGT